MGLPAVVGREFGLDGAQLGQAITLLSAQINLANHRLLRMIAEFDVHGGWRDGGVTRSCAHWLAANCGMAIGAAREKVRVARCLAGLPEIEQAFAEGDLSYSKVRAITRAATPENESFMVSMAERHSASHLEKLMGKYEPVLEPGLSGLLDEPASQGAVGQGGEAAAGEGVGSVAGFGADAVGAVESGLEPGAAAGSGVEFGAQCGAQAAPDVEALREQARELYWFQDKDGMWIIHAKLPPEQGQLVMKALKAVARPLEEERQDEWKARQKKRMQAVAQNILRRSREACESDESGGCVGMPAKAGYRRTEEEISAETFSQRTNQVREDVPVVEAEPGPDGERPELPAHTAYERAGEKISAETFSQRTNQVREDVPVVEAESSPDGERPELPAHTAYERAEEKISAETFSQHMNQIRADALVVMVEHFLASGPDYRELQGLNGSERCQVVLHVDVNTLREQRSGVCCTHGRSHFEDKPWLSPATARRLGCDASLVTVLEDDAGQVLNVGRRSRIVPAHIRRALKERDGVCQYPGCHESEYVDAHHIQHWAEGGETSLDNLVLLCRHHHRQLHRGSFDARILDGV